MGMLSMNSSVGTVRSRAWPSTVVLSFVLPSCRQSGNYSILMDTSLCARFVFINLGKNPCYSPAANAFSRAAQRTTPLSALIFTTIDVG
jgi:hypothetical protein